uniref:Uncharacterized protein n=1 Tax=Anguilla anguilla TaxID=7936 RepID=A0A0E9V8I8_ANGAN
MPVPLSHSSLYCCPLCTHCQSKGSIFHVTACDYIARCR